MLKLIEKFGYYGKLSGEELIDQFVIDMDDLKQVSYLREYLSDFNDEEIDQFLNDESYILETKNYGDWDEPSSYCFTSSSKEKKQREIQSEYTNRLKKLDKQFKLY